MLRLIPATASEGAPAPCEKRGAGLALKAAASTSHHERAPKERGRWTAQRAFVPHGPTTTSAARRERSASSSTAPFPSDSERRNACVAWQAALVLRCAL